MLLVIDQKIEGEVRERMLVSYYRYRYACDALSHTHTAALLLTCTKSDGLKMYNPHCNA